MKQIKATTEATIWGTRNAWSLTEGPEAVQSKRVTVEVEIQGSRKAGYNLVISPDGFFTADYWYPTFEDVLADALDLFGLEEADFE